MKIICCQGKVGRLYYSVDDNNKRKRVKRQQGWDAAPCDGHTDITRWTQSSAKRDATPRRASSAKRDATPRRASSAKRTATPRRASDERDWRIQAPLGKPGKEGTVSLAIDTKTNQVAAMKQFRRTKAASTLTREYNFLRKSADAGASPAVMGLDVPNRRMFMEPMQRTLQQVLLDQRGALTEEQQRRILDLYRILNEVGIYHGDPNPLNFMVDGAGTFYMIDFGFGKETSKMKDQGPNPNMPSLWHLLYSPSQGIVARRQATTPPILLMEALVNYQRQHNLRSVDRYTHVDDACSYWYNMSCASARKKTPLISYPSPAKPSAKETPGLWDVWGWMTRRAKD